jgi:uncharacterized alpha-E superfamily protein
MYRLSRRTRVSREDALEFVLRDAQFPRACLFCLRQIDAALRALPRGAGVLGTLAGVSSFLSDAALVRLDQPGLHQLIDHLQLHINAVHDAIAYTYFPSQGAPTQRQMQEAADAAVRTLPLFADAPEGPVNTPTL